MVNLFSARSVYSSFQTFHRMRLRPLALAGLAAVAFSTFPRVAAAEPVTFRFDVRIDYRCSVDGCDAFSASFPMWMTMDDAVSSSLDRPWYHERWYGVPTFSTVPLERPDIRADAARMYTPGFYSASLIDERWDRVAHAYSGFEVTTAEGTFNWNTSLYRAEDDVWPLPHLTAAAMARFLGSRRGAGFFGYNFSGQLPGGGLTPDSVGYLGTATFAGEQSPVPEPASVLLIGSGLLAMLRKRRSGTHGRGNPLK